MGPQNLIKMKTYEKNEDKNPQDQNFEVVSNCCGAAPISNGDNDSTDFGICPDCGEHCDYIEANEDQD